MKALGGGGTNDIWNPATEPIRVDVIFLYSNNAVNSEGSEDAPRERIQRLLRGTNDRFTNNLAGARLNPVFIVRSNSGSIQTDLQSLRTHSRVASKPGGWCGAAALVQGSESPGRS